jgi:hypothetical protein
VIKVTGEKKVIKELKRFVKAYPNATGAAMYEEALAIEAESVKLVPVDTGRLSTTHYVSPPKKDASKITCKIGYGTNYALPVHERTKVRHTVGQAKYLEVPFKAAMSGLASRMVKRIKKHVKSNTPFTVGGSQAKKST